MGGGGLRTMDNLICQEVVSAYRELDASGRLRLMGTFCAHGDCSVLRHSLGVAYVGLYRCDERHLACDRRSLLVAALLHDYYLYDWHEDDRSHRLHGFRHPGCALRNAREDFSLDDREIDAIAHHMFPLTPQPPRYVEGRVLCMADKYCAIYEMSYAQPYEELYRMVCEETCASVDEREAGMASTDTHAAPWRRRRGTLPGTRASVIAFLLRHTLSTERAI